LPKWVERATQPTHPFISQDANAVPGDYLPEIKLFLDRRSGWIPDEDYRFIYGFVGYLDGTANFTHTLEHPSATRTYISVELAREGQKADMRANPGWISVFHGTSFYALSGVNQWGVLAGTDPDLHGILTVDGKLLVGTYTSPLFKTAVGYATPHKMFGTDRWFRVVLELYGREADVKKISRKGGNQQWIFPEQSLTLHRMIFMPNAPPDVNEQRFMTWEPALEALLEWQVPPEPVVRILQPPPPPAPKPKSKALAKAKTPPIPIKCGICPSSNVVATATGWTCKDCGFFQRQKDPPVVTPTSKGSQWQIDDPVIDHLPRNSLSKGQSKGSALPPRQDFRRTKSPLVPPPPPPIRSLPNLAPSSVGRPRWMCLAHNSRWQEEWTEYCGDHQDALHEAHDKFNAGDGPPGTTLYQGKKTTWDIDFIAMTQTNPKTKTVRVIALEEQVPVDLTYVDAGPARLPYKPAWNLDTDPIAPSKASLILCNLPCEFSIFNVENRSSHRCGERCKLPHQHYGACNCNGHTALQDLQAFASKSDEVLLEAPPPPPDPLDRSGSWDAMQKFKELREEREASGTWESAQEVHSPSPESDPDVGWSYDRSTQEWTPPPRRDQDSDKAKQARKGSHSRSRSPTHTPDDDNWGTWAGDEAASSQEPGSQEQGPLAPWRDQYHGTAAEADADTDLNDIAQESDPYPGWRQSESGFWWRRRQSGEKRRGKPRVPKEDKETREPSRDRQ
jgi:hypothetical protein